MLAEKTKRLAIILQLLLCRQLVFTGGEGTVHVSQNTVCHSVFQTEKHKIYQGTQLIYSNELTRGWELLAARYPICHLQLTARQKTGEVAKNSTIKIKADYKASKENIKHLIVVREGGRKTTLYSPCSIGCVATYESMSSNITIDAPTPQRFTITVTLALPYTPNGTGSAKVIGYIVGGLVGIVLVILISRKVACAIPRPSCCQREANKHRKTQGKADSVNQDNEQNEVTLSLVDEGYMIQSSKV